MKNWLDKKDNVVILLSLLWMLTLSIHGMILNEATNIISVIVSIAFIGTLFKVLFFDEIIKNKEKQDKDKNESQ